MDPVTLTEELVSYDTVSERPNAALCQRLTELLEPLGAQLEVQRSPKDPQQHNLLARFGPEGRGGLALAGHTDTVPFDASMRANTRPERDGRRLYGRGTCDMKGAIAAMIHAARRGEDLVLAKPLWMVFTFQEEIGCHGAKLLESLRPLPVDHCIIGEPTGLRPVTLHKGYAVARIDLYGSPCHSSDPDRGASAVHGAARAVDGLLALGEELKGEGGPSDGPLQPPWTTLNVGLFSGGTARNVVPDRASFCLEMRPLPSTDVAGLLARAEARAREAASTVPGLRLDFVPVETNPPLGTPSDGRLVSWLVERQDSEEIAVPFYTEAPMFTRMGAETCVCGPGEIAQAHRVDEWVEFDALEAASDLYLDAIREFCT